ncbi:hypothetical protein ACFO5Q_08920 [Kordiimonas lipolytica]|uniref:Uncharacterized protein n=1 Tax=Kordiimonas lipolytica TaxID=1662421 RepID=A0ABV8U9T4_9PROT|nr:hypothetical protein [Kordiimonas lipolytica]
MFDNTPEKIAAAHELEQRLINEVFDYVNEDDERAGLGLNAAFRACITLTKGSTMTAQTRMAFAQQVYLEMTSDLALSTIRGHQGQ